jgi:hypothetical protein
VTSLASSSSSWITSTGDGLPAALSHPVASVGGCHGYSGRRRAEERVVFFLFLASIGNYKRQATAVVNW